MGVLYHNPRCSKSRQTLALVEASNQEHDVVLYLENPLDIDSILSLLSRLEDSPESLVRVNDAEPGQELSEFLASNEGIAELLSKQPKLMQRPIFDDGSTARICRPPELVCGMLDDA